MSLRDIVHRSDLGPDPNPSDSGVPQSRDTAEISRNSSVSSPVTTTPISLGPPTPHPLTYGPGKRSHKKSRTGCGICKARKIKCDERHPSCLNCISHGVECPFATQGGSAGSTKAALPIPTRSKPTAPCASCKIRAAIPITPTTPTPASPGEDPLPLLELELLHNFTLNTYATLAGDPTVLSFWQGPVVQLGLKCDYIMRTVLAISALHLAYSADSEERRDSYTAQGILLHQKASRSAVKFMNSLSSTEMDKDATASLFLFSLLTIYFALASPRTRSHADGKLFFINETSFPDWTFLVTGGKSLSKVLGERGHDTILAPFLAYGGDIWRQYRSKMEEKDSGEPPLAELRARINSTVRDEGLLQTYSHALDELELALVAMKPPAKPDVLAVMLWLWEVSDSLVPLLKVPEQEAVAIFAHFCILLKHHESTWWLQGWGDHLVRRAHAVLDEEHRGWIEWPVREVGLG
ncbi:putative transcription factor [Podospora australis]|uniref:Transcription factor n=1 Tax=Podospora australis TaxID=1536484 RepID=A0AAN6WRZ1_9PEZI|nr:putative transcription factor [Podospora australis]